MFPQSATVTGEFREADTAMRAVGTLIQSFGGGHVRVKPSTSISVGGLAVQVAAGHSGTAASSLLRSNGATAVSTRNTYLRRFAR